MKRELLNEIVFSQMLLDTIDYGSISPTDPLDIAIASIELFLNAESGVFDAECEDLNEKGLAGPFVEKWCTDLNNLSAKFHSIHDEDKGDFELTELENFVIELKQIVDNYIAFCIKVYNFITNNPNTDWQVDIIGTGDVIKY